LTNKGGTAGINPSLDRADFFIFFLCFRMEV